jgi:hypothetical protein
LISLFSGVIESQFTKEDGYVVDDDDRSIDSLSDHSGDVRTSRNHKQSLLESTEPKRTKRTGETDTIAMSDPQEIGGVEDIAEPPKVHRKKIESHCVTGPSDLGKPPKKLHRAVEEMDGPIDRPAARRTVASLASHSDDMSIPSISDVLQELDETQRDRISSPLKQSLSSLTKSQKMRKSLIAEASHRNPGKEREGPKNNTSSRKVSSPGSNEAPSPTIKQEEDSHNKESPKSTILLDTTRTRSKDVQHSECCILGASGKDAKLSQNKSTAGDNNTMLSDASYKTRHSKESSKSQSAGKIDANKLVKPKGSPSPQLPAKLSFSRRPPLPRTADDSPSKPQAYILESCGRNSDRKSLNWSPKVSESIPDQTTTHRTPSPSPSPNAWSNSRGNPSPGLTEGDRSRSTGDSGPHSTPVFFSAVRRVGTNQQGDGKTVVKDEGTNYSTTIVLTSSGSSLHPSNVASGNCVDKSTESINSTQKPLEMAETPKKLPISCKQLSTPKPPESQNGFKFDCLPVPECDAKSFSIDQYTIGLQHHIETIVNDLSMKREVEQSVTLSPSIEESRQSYNGDRCELGLRGHIEDILNDFTASMGRKQASVQPSFLEDVGENSIEEVAGEPIKVCLHNQLGSVEIQEISMKRPLNQFGQVDKSKEKAFLIDVHSPLSLFDSAMAKASKELSSLLQTGDNTEQSSKPNEREIPPASPDLKMEGKMIPLGRINAKYRTRYAEQPEPSDDIIIVTETSALSTDDKGEAKERDAFSLSNIAAAATTWDSHGMMCFNPKSGEDILEVDAEQPMSTNPLEDNLKSGWIDFHSVSCFQKDVITVT